MKDYNMWGIRFDGRIFEVGDEISKSHASDADGNETDEFLPGTSTIYVSDERDFLDYLDGIQNADCGELDKYNWALKQRYCGEHIYLVAINSSWGHWIGEDEGEVIMNGAEVVRIIK